MKRIGVVISDARELDACRQRLVEAQVPMIHAQIEQSDHASIYIEDQYLENALHALSTGGFITGLP